MIERVSLLQIPDLPYLVSNSANNNKKKKNTGHAGSKWLAYKLKAAG